MAKSNPLARWDRWIARYLESRRALGRAYTVEEQSLGHLRAFLACTGRRDLDAPGFEAWRAEFQHLKPATRISREYAAYRLCRYLQKADVRHFVPDPATLTRLKGRPIPTIFDEHQIACLLASIDRWKPSPDLPLRIDNLRIAVTLLYTTGMRRGELARLRIGDVDEQLGILQIRDSKFHKSRSVPLSASALAALREFLLARRRQGYPETASAPLLCRPKGQPVTGPQLLGYIKRALERAGIRNSEGRVPHPHDFRHSFAVGALLRWYREGGDVQANLPKLAMYMGHVSAASTAYYLRHMPAVVEQASERFGRSYEQIVQGGAR